LYLDSIISYVSGPQCAQRRLSFLLNKITVAFGWVRTHARAINIQKKNKIVAQVILFYICYPYNWV